MMAVSLQAVDMSQQMFAGKVLTGRIALTVDQTMWVDPVEERMKLDYVGVTTGLRSPQQAIVKAGLAERNHTHLSALADHLDVILHHHDNHTHLADTRLATICHSCVQSPLAVSRWNKLNDRDSVVISSFFSPSLFYVQLVSGHKR